MRKRILVVDDEPDVRFALSTLLTCKGFEVEEAEDGQKALEAIAVRRFDLIILDLLMPHAGGYEVIQRLPPSVREGTPVILLTAKSEDKDIMKGYALGATYYITKPFRNRRVVDVTEYLIGDLSAAQHEALELRL